MFLHSYDFALGTPENCIHFIYSHCTYLRTYVTYIYKGICECVIYYSLRKMKMSVGVRYDTFG